VQQRRASVTERLLTAAEVGELLSVPESWVRRDTRAGRLPHLELGRYRRYERAAVQRAGQWRKHEPKVSG